MATTSEMLLGVLGVYLKYNFIYGIVLYSVLSLALVSWQRNSLNADKDKQCFNKYTIGNGVIMTLLIVLLLVSVLSFFLKDTAQGWINTWYGSAKVE
jgi:hypothetical protein